MTGTRNNSKHVSKSASKNASGAKVNGNKQNILNKQKVLLPTLREQQRYLVYRLQFDDNKINGKMFDFNAVHNNIISQCNAFLGVFDGGKAGLMSAKFNPETMKGIIRVSNVYVDKLKVCLGLIKTLNNSKVIVDCVFVSGMLNKAIEKMDS